MKVFTIILVILSLGNSSCEKVIIADKYYPLIVINNSIQTVRVFMANEIAEKQYPDTTLPDFKPSAIKIPSNKRGYFDSKIPWNEVLAKLPADTLSVFIMDAEVYDNEPWDSITVNYNILKRLDLSFEDLKNNNFQIIYQ
jgi:hypothetical protein